MINCLILFIVFRQAMHPSVVVHWREPSKNSPADKRPRRDAFVMENYKKSKETFGSSWTWSEIRVHSSRTTKWLHRDTFIVEKTRVVHQMIHPWVVVYGGKLSEISSQRTTTQRCILTVESPTKFPLLVKVRL